jgi:4-hydroxy-4-methyl-2-oxoglutarate aldolase
MKKVINDFQRPSRELIERFQKAIDCYSASCVFGDAMLREGVMDSAIKPYERAKTVGVALTVKLDPNDLVDCLDALKVAQPGDFIVVNANGETETSIWGGLMSGLCLQKGVVGAIVDGGIRDIDESRDLGFPVWSRSITPRATHTILSGRLDPIQINIPIVCGGVIVNPGDIIVADEIGAVVIPKEHAEEIVEKAEKQAEMEELTRQQIKQGKTVDELLAEFGRL